MATAGGTDTVSGGRGNDVIYARVGDQDALYCGEGEDSVFCNEGIDKVVDPLVPAFLRLR